MSDQPQHPHDPNASPYGPAYAGSPGRTPRPAPVSTAVKLIWTNIALSVLSAALTFLLLDSIIDQQLEVAGVAGDVDADTVRSAVVLAAVLGLLIGVALYALVAVFISRGANWARIVYTVLAVLSVLGTVLGFGGQPLLLTLISLVSLVLTVTAVVLLFKPESSAWFRAR